MNMIHAITAAEDESFHLKIEALLKYLLETETELKAWLQIRCNHYTYSFMVYNRTYV